MYDRYSPRLQQDAVSVCGLLLRSATPRGKARVGLVGEVLDSSDVAGLAGLLVGAAPMLDADLQLLLRQQTALFEGALSGLHSSQRL